MKMRYETPLAKRITFSYEETVVATGGSASGSIHWTGNEAYTFGSECTDGFYAYDMYPVISRSWTPTNCDSDGQG